MLINTFLFIYFKVHLYFYLDKKLMISRLDTFRDRKCTLEQNVILLIDR